MIKMTGATKKIGKGTTMVAPKHGAEITKEVDVPLKNQDMSTGPFAQVSVEASMTVNLGDYNSARVSVGLILPCGVHEIDGAYMQGKEWVDERMSGLLADLKK